MSQRTERALACQGAQALISIHANSGSQKTISGIETFCHQPKLFTSRLKEGNKNVYPVVDIIDQTLFERSNLLAQLVHQNMLDAARQQNKQVVDRNVKHKVAQLLLGSDLPSIIVEVGFLTNEREATLLQNKSYQKSLAEGISKGLDQFFNVM